ncbi:MAG: protein kinase [Minicystis sp.]
MTEPQTTEAPVREGDVLAGKYRVERVLGVGGMGVVVAAMHMELDQRVALKFLLPSAAQNPAVVARFSREAKAAAKIKSEHVARVSDVGTMDNGIPYIVMEYLEGHDLSHALSIQTRLAPSVAVDYILQACEAIAEAHAAGFVHRDLKPGNLFLARRADGSDIVKVLDFGISKAVISDNEPSSVKPGQLTRTTDIFGSPMYMSPEQLKSSRDVDPRADIWAIGVILYELVTGKSPFDRPTVAETFGAILYEKPESIRKHAPECPAGLEAAILRCVEKDANARFQNVAELAKGLLPFAEHSSRLVVERTSRVLRRAGVAVDTVPPPSELSRAAATGMAPSGGASTRTAWGEGDRAPKPRSGARVIVIAAAGLVLAAAAFVGVTRFGKRPVSAVPPPMPDRPIAAQTAAPSAVPTVAPSTTPTSVPIAAPSNTAAASVSAAPTVVPAGPPDPAVKPHHGKQPPAKTASPSPPPAQTVAPLPTAVPAAPPPPPPPPKPEDPNDFGDRK